VRRADEQFCSDERGGQEKFLSNFCFQWFAASCVANISFCDGCTQIFPSTGLSWVSRLFVNAAWFFPAFTTLLCAETGKLPATISQLISRWISY
jgi:hypothetical protein